MNYDKLVNLIVEEIYKKINTTNISEKVNKPRAVLLYENDKSKFDILSNEFDIIDFDNSIKDCEIVIISRLCMRGLCNLALGMNVSDDERFVLKMLMKGRSVYVLDEGIEYKRYKETAPKDLYNKYLSYEDDICKFGVKIINDLNSITSKNKTNYKKQSISEVVSKSNQSLNEDKIKIDDEFSIDLRSKKLISESDLRKPMVNGIKNVIVSKKSIITPLAVDFMRAHNLKLKKN